MRHISRTHRVNLTWLYDVVQDDGNNSTKYASTKHQCADIFTNGFTGAEMRNVLMSIVGLFNMVHHKMAKYATKPCRAISSRDARIAMEMHSR